MRISFWVLAVLCLIAGLLFGALNPTPLDIELYFTRLELSAGVALLGSALLGALLGGVVVGVSVAWPLRRRLTRLARQTEATEPGSP